MSEVSITLAERHKTHGDFAEQSRIAQRFKEVLRSGTSWQNAAPNQREALDMIAHKMARVVTGDPRYSDHWHDIQGYAKRVEELL